ncbi:ribonuclease HII [Paracoccus gahaiensis]|uniref:Ribonuclease HII n=1 Tax=Paracoccus gahaiensis TaxID=1706839 RepID=A0A4U0RDL2_9RHOB|nr:ribonuclease HII [Paracoccus gahaiensis]TJZ92630.1 ribonuclease HII [Paracoccus gahaiensis]
MTPDHAVEAEALARGARWVAGVDEAGRGPLAGPVTAAAVILDPANIPPGLNDSKQLTAKRREALALWLMEHCDWSVAHVDVAQIDALNILRASHVAMCRALDGLSQRPCHVLVDGNMLPRDLDLPATAVIKGDARCLTIAAASVLAKVLRDRIMVDLAQQYPGYGWEANAGYPTPAHKRALLDLGVTPYHRRSFAPVHNILCKAQLISG